MSNGDQAERCLLGTLFLNTESAKIVKDLLSERDFSNGLHARIFKTAMDIVQAGEFVDISSVYARLANDPLLNEHGGIGFLADLLSVVPNCQLITEYAKTIKREARRRGYLSMLSESIVALNDFGKDPDETILQMMDKCRDAIQNISDESVRSVGDCIKDAVKDIMESMDKGHKDSIRTGFQSVDNVLFQLPRGSLTIIAARPAMGKTAFGVNVMINQCVAGSDHHGLLISLEMSSVELSKRIIAQLAHVPGNALRTGKMISEDWEKVLNVAEKYTQSPLFIDDSADSSVEGVCAKIRQAKIQHKIDFVAIDYIQLMTSSSKKATNREQEVSIISRRLKMLAKELDIPIIALAQLNRAVDSRTDKRPFMSDLRESGSIEQNADNIIFLHRPGYYNADCQNPDDAEIIIAKQRAGSTGIVHLIWNAEQTRFCEPLSEF